MNDSEYMKMALQLAEKGCGRTAPNPMAGAVIVKNSKIIGYGWHEKYGGLHAERNALTSCSESPEHAEMYVTLEPCSHYGKQPPCVSAIIEAGISRVIVGCSDPNPLVNGKGIRTLREHGISVTEHILESECIRLNEVFFHYISTGRPFVIMKYAMTMDGKIAAHTGLSKWITGERARSYVALQRHRYTAVMTGVGTVLCDNPMLNSRIENAVNPVRIICDTHLRTPLSANVVCTARESPTILATCCKDPKRRSYYEKQGCRILSCAEKDGRVDLIDLTEKLGQMKIDSILMEGGGSLNWSALQSGIVQKVQAYIAPKLFGGETAKTAVEGTGVDSPNEAFQLQNSRLIPLGEDFMIESEVKQNVYGDY